jgi:hypothetical protein
MPFEIVTLNSTDSFSRAYGSLKNGDVAALDLSGWTFDLTIKADRDAVATVLSLPTSSFTVNNETGEAGFTLTPALLAPLTIGKSFYFRTVAHSPDPAQDTTIDEGLLCRNL